VIQTTFLLEHPADIDYRLMSERVGSALEIDLRHSDQPRPGGAIAIPLNGDLIMGMRIDAPYPEPLDARARLAFWWP
jgi:hypothetical protein